MAKKTETTITLIDDLDGSKADRTVAFAFDGSSYEIELSKKNATALQKALTPYINAAKKVRGTGRVRAAATPRTTRSKPRTDLPQIREWAQGQGLEVSERGRIANTVIEQYDAAH